MGPSKNYTIFEIRQNTVKSSGNLRWLAVSQIPMEKPSANAGMKNSQMSDIIYIYICVCVCVCVCVCKYVFIYWVIFNRLYKYLQWRETHSQEFIFRSYSISILIWKYWDFLRADFYPICAQCIVMIFFWLKMLLA